jgi:2'-5' RNA ligase
MSTLGKPVTLGVLITIPEPHASVLADWRRRVGDDLGELIPPHVTLLRPTSVDQDDLAAVRAHLAKAAEAASPFPMHLLGTGTFRPTSPVVFIQVARGIAECQSLEASIRSGPLLRDLDFTYHPHVTVAQEVPDAALDEAYEGLANFGARFPVDHFSLFCSAGDGAWTHEDYRLGI